jgi:hypothetical protein
MSKVRLAEEPTRVDYLLARHSMSMSIVDLDFEICDGLLWLYVQL